MERKSRNSPRLTGKSQEGSSPGVAELLCSPLDSGFPQVSGVWGKVSVRGMEKGHTTMETPHAEDEGKEVVRGLL